MGLLIVGHEGSYEISKQVDEMGESSFFIFFFLQLIFLPILYAYITYKEQWIFI